MALQQKKCPGCQRSLPISAKTCRCGYDFITRKMKLTTPAGKRSRGKSPIHVPTLVSGLAMLVTGLAVVALAIQRAAYFGTGIIRLAWFLCAGGFVTAIRGMHGMQKD